MDETNRLNRRSRARPYDLRRKVLLKNFLREQLTYITPSPEISDTSSDTTNTTTFGQDSSSSIDISEDLHSTNDENDAHSMSPTFSEPATNNITTAAEVINTCAEEECDLSSPSTSNYVPENVKVAKPRSKFSRFSSLIRLRSSTKKKKNKGISKAKHHCKIKSPVKTRSLKSGFEKFFSGKSLNQGRKKVNDLHSGKETSFLTIFKSRRENKKPDKTENVNKLNILLEGASADNAATCSTSNQSVQTDLSWPMNELNNVEQSSRLMHEENRLLSQSLSYFKSDTEESFGSRNRRRKTSFEFSARNRNVFESIPIFDKQTSSNVQNFHDNNSSLQNSKSRILRSKSVQIHSSRKTTKPCHRTRSMNCHDIKDSSHPSFLVVPPRKSSHNSPMSALKINHTEHRIPRVRRSSAGVLRTLPVNSTGRTLQRRSSMPERTNSENLRSLVCRRSGSVHESNHKKQSVPFHTLPAQAFY